MSQFPEERLNLSASEGFGYFPSYPGMKLKKDRYEIIRKLGYGPRSSVWLVVDSRTYSYFAIKIFTVHETLKKPSCELVALTITEKNGFLNLHKSFTENSLHGTHLCLVLSISGLSYEDLRMSSPTKSLPRHIVQRAIVCVVGELGNLHKCGLIYGALTSSNIVFGIYKSREQIDAELAKLPPCTIERKIAIDDVEYPIVRSHPIIPDDVEWNDSRLVINEHSIRLNNLGHAQKTEDTKQTICTRIMKGAKKTKGTKEKKRTPTWEKSRMDKSLRPPEVILGLPYSSKTDIWMLGCATFHMLTGKPLVPENEAADDGIMLGWLIAMSGGQITPDIALKAKSEYFDENGLFKLGIPEETLEGQISSSGVVPADDIPGIVEFIQTCLTLDPAHRPSPDDLFRHEWVQPALEFED